MSLDSAAQEAGNQNGERAIESHSVRYMPQHLRVTYLEKHFVQLHLRQLFASTHPSAIPKLQLYISAHLDECLRIQLQESFRPEDVCVLAEDFPIT